MVPLKLKPGPEGTLPFILAEQEANDLVVPLLYKTVLLNAASVGHTVVDTVVNTVVVVGVIADGGPDGPTGGGAAKAQSAQRVSKSREISCEGICGEVGIGLGPCQLFTPDGPFFIQERDLCHRISGRSCLTECHCMSLPIVGLISLREGSERTRLQSTYLCTIGRRYAASARWQLEEIRSLL
jgi:hypothetical protein